METLRLVIVTWHDAWADHDNFASAHGLAQTHEPMVVESLGWIVTDDDKGISIVNEQSTEEGKAIYRGRTFIPRAMVQSVQEYKLSKPRQPKVKASQEEA
jgi:hypothetical protein